MSMTRREFTKAQAAAIAAAAAGLPFASTARLSEPVFNAAGPTRS